MALRPILLAGAGILGVGYLLHIVGLATPSWIMLRDEDSELNEVGLWKVCFTYEGVRQCKSIPESGKTDAFKACEATAILGFIAGTVAMAMVAWIVAMDVLGKDYPRGLHLGMLVASVASCIMIVICVMVFALKVMLDGVYTVPVYFGYSFALSILGACLILIGGVLSLIAPNVEAV